MGKFIPISRVHSISVNNFLRELAHSSYTLIVSSQFPPLYIITVNNYVDLLIRLFVCFATNPRSCMGKSNIASFYVHGTKHNGLPVIKAKYVCKINEKVNKG